MLNGSLHRPLAFAVLLLLSACKQQTDTAESGKIRELTERAKQLEMTFGKMGKVLSSLEPSACSDGTIRATLSKSQNRSVPFVDTPTLADFAAGKRLDPARPLAYLVPQVLRARRPTGEVSDAKSATDAAFDAVSLLDEYDYLAALAYQLTPPRADGKGFHGGKLEGTLGLFDLETGEALCASPVFVQSHEEIAGKPGQTPQQAADKDFELELRRSLQEALRGLSRELNLELR